MHQNRSYVIALENAKLVDGMYLDENDKGLSFRTYKDYLLIGGGSHKTGKDGGGWRELEEIAAKYYPKAKIKYKWAAQDCITLDDMPYIGRYSEKTPDLFVATGFNKWGMTQSMVSANILSDIIQGKKNEYEDIFSPQRTILHPRLAENAFTSVFNLLTPTAPRCPHLGCALKWNKLEHTWDCPCHGSRFSENGKLLDNPATGNIKKP
jgi:glycine/D-amino acid oxidase-like deaminating enzyme